MYTGGTPRTAWRSHSWGLGLWSSGEADNWPHESPERRRTGAHRRLWSHRSGLLPFIFTNWHVSEICNFLTYSQREIVRFLPHCSMWLLQWGRKHCKRLQCNTNGKNIEGFVFVVSTVTGTFIFVGSWTTSDITCLLYLSVWLCCKSSHPC